MAVSNIAQGYNGHRKWQCHDVHATRLHPDSVQAVAAVAAGPLAAIPVNPAANLLAGSLSGSLSESWAPNIPPGPRQSVV